MKSDAEIQESLEAALQRVVALGKQDLRPRLHHLQKLTGQRDQLCAAKILAGKELQRSESGHDASRNTFLNEKSQLSVENDELQEALLNHKLYRDTLQQMAFTVQMQEAVKQSLQKVDMEETMTHFPERGELLSHCSSNLKSCKELASVVKEEEDLNKEILELQLKYSNLLKDIRRKWEALSDNQVPVSGDNQALVNLQERVKVRESKIQLVATMVQALIATSGFLWGGSDYYIQVLLLCDCIETHNSVEQDRIISEIQKIHESRKGKQLRTSV